MTYIVMITGLTRIERVHSYEVLRDRVFYVCGSDFEQWIVLREGQTVTVTEETQQ